jgi:hypothetical protein
MSMGVARAQTVEDAEPHRWPAMTLHHEHTSAEFVRYEFRVRRPWACADFDPHLVLRLSQTSTRVTASLETVRCE